MEELEKINAKKRKIAHERAMKQVPDAVMEAFAKHPDYIAQKQNARVYGEDIADYAVENFEKPVPYDGVWDNKVTLTKAESKEYKKLLDQSRELKSEIDSLQYKIEIALYNLRSYKKIREEFPEAGEYLPDGEKKTELMVQVSDIRSKLKKKKEETKDNA